MFWHWRSWEDIKAASTFTLANYANIILIVVFVLFALRQAKVKQVSSFERSQFSLAEALLFNLEAFPVQSSPTEYTRLMLPPVSRALPPKPVEKIAF